MTDFENAAYVTFIVLLTRVILSFDLNLLIPLSKVNKQVLSDWVHALITAPSRKLYTYYCMT